MTIPTFQVPNPNLVDGRPVAGAGEDDVARATANQALALAQTVSGTSGGGASDGPIAKAAFAIAVAGTDAGHAALTVAGEAFTLSTVGTNAAQAANVIGGEAFTLAQVGTNAAQAANVIAGEAFTLAQVGTTAAANALAVANSALSAATNALGVFTVDTSYFVSNNGNDGNYGTLATVPFATISKAATVAGSKLIPAGVTVSIRIANGTYPQTAPIFLTLTGAGSLNVIGNPTSPSSVSIPAGAALSSNGIFTAQAQWGGSMMVSGGSLSSPFTLTHGLLATNSATLTFGQMTFGPFNTGDNILSSANGVIAVAGNYTVASGGGFAQMASSTGGIYKATATIQVTCTGTSTFTGAFASITNLSVLNTTTHTFNQAAGKVIGSRYTVSGNSVIANTGGDQNYFPGDSAGVASTGGIYG